MSQPSRNILSNSFDTLNHNLELGINSSEALIAGKPAPKRSRTQGVKFFLTYPQCDCSPQLALTRVLFKYPNLKWVVATRENHADGSPHLHLLVILAKRIRYTSSTKWDFVTGKHGNYQLARNVEKVLRYVTKGNNYVSHGINVESYLKSKQSKKGLTFEWLALQMREGKSIEELDEERPAIVLENLRKIQDYAQFLKRKKRKVSGLNLIPWTPIDVLTLLPDFRTMGNWINKNLGSPRIFKQRQLWIYGATNLGKTSLVMHLMKFFRIYYVPLDTNNLDDYEDDEYDLIVFDEYKGQKSITWMNAFVQGNHFPIHRRYHSTLKIKNLPVIVLSNYCIEEAYSKVNLINPYRLDSLRARFQVIEVTKFIKIF